MYKAGNISSNVNIVHSIKQSLSSAIRDAHRTEQLSLKK